MEPHTIEDNEALHNSTLDLSLVQKGNEFSKLRTYIPSVFILLIVITQCVVTTLVETDVIKFNITVTPIESAYFFPFHFLLVVQSVTWAIVAALDRTVHYLATKHKKHGYVSFYTNTKFVRRLPCYISSTGCAVCLLAAGCWGDARPPWHKVKPSMIMLSVVVLQDVFILPAVVYYISIVLKFNKSRTMPDMQRYLRDSASPIQVQIGNTRSVEELEITIDKQAEIIQSLQTHNQVLGRRIMSLHKQIKV